MYLLEVAALHLVSLLFPFPDLRPAQRGTDRRLSTTCLSCSTALHLWLDHAETALPITTRYPMESRYGDDKCLAVLCKYA